MWKKAKLFFGFLLAIWGAEMVYHGTTHSTHDAAFWAMVGGIFLAFGLTILVPMLTKAGGPPYSQ